jgi:hypothetical protein
VQIAAVKHYEQKKNTATYWREYKHTRRECDGLFQVGLVPQHLPKENEYQHEISVTTTVTQSKFEPRICRYLWTCLHSVMDDVA